MARGRATEDELAAGIRRVGVLSAVAAPEGTRRDNPFAEPPLKSQKPVHANETPSSSPDRVEVAPTPAPAADRPVQRPPRPSTAASSCELALYTDPVTVPMTAEMRTRANLLAAELQRRRTDRSVRFTSNTVFRVAIETFFEHFDLLPGEHANTEDEFRRLVRARLPTGRRSKPPSA